MQSTWLAQYLVKQADALNQTYRLARQGDSVQFASSFSAFILEALDPLLANLEHWAPARKAALTDTAYQSGLVLLRSGWLVGDQRDLANHLFAQLLPEWLAPYPEQGPRLLLQLLNTLSHLPSVNQRTRLLEQWQRCLPNPEATPDSLLVLGWMAGLPQYRLAALAALERQPDLAKVLDLGATQLFAHPWWQGPQAGWQSEPIVLGASTWLGGEFSDLPQLLTTSEHTLIRAGGDCWQLHADAFGHVLLAHRSGQAQLVPELGSARLPTNLANRLRDFDQPRQCLEQPHEWVISFRNRYAVMVIPKTGDSR